MERGESRLPTDGVAILRVVRGWEPRVFIRGIATPSVGQNSEILHTRIRNAPVGERDKPQSGRTSLVAALSNE
jgi:hypothetical protein